MNEENEKYHGAEDRYHVCLLYTKEDSYKTDIEVRSLIVKAKSEDEALGFSIKYFEEQTKGYSLIGHSVQPIDDSEILTLKSIIKDLENKCQKYEETLRKI